MDIEEFLENLSLFVATLLIILLFIIITKPDSNKKEIKPIKKQEEKMNETEFIKIKKKLYKFLRHTN